ncbi:MAG: hypothetical protein LUG57_09605, partial [Oscillospiraceae bacterium]|nr:hypothetical protein [Oscillospiraceae bacterium]
MIDTGLEPGGALTAYLAGMTPDQAVKMGRELCVQLPREPEEFHGGVWPGNIRLDWEGKAVLGEPDHSAAAGRSADQVEYVAPEYFWDNIAAAAGDVYAVALLVYAGCNGGRLPFQPAGGPTEKDRSDALRRRMKGEPIPRPQGVSDPLWSVLEKALSYEAEGRYLTARELLAALSDTDEALPSLESLPVAAAAADGAAETAANTEEIPPAEEPMTDESVPGEEAPAAETTPEETPPEPETPQEAPAEAESAEEGVSGETAPLGEPAPVEPVSQGETAPEEPTWTKELDGLSQETAHWEAELEAAAAGLPEREPSAPVQGGQPAADVRRQYTVQKDFEKKRRTRKEPSMAPAAQRKKQKSLLGPVLSVIGAAVLLIVVLVLVFGGDGDGTLQQTSQSFATSPATAEPTVTPITI